VAAYDVDVHLVPRADAAGVTFSGASASSTNYIFTQSHSGFATQTSTATEVFGEDYLSTGTETIANTTRNMITVNVVVAAGAHGTFDVVLSCADGFNDGHTDFATTFVPGIITVVQAPPLVTVTSPTSTTVAGRGNAVRFSATAVALGPGAAISAVEFYDGATKLGNGSLSGSVWTYSWTTSVATTYGLHQITAKATDNGGLATVSAPVAIQIRILGDGNGDNIVDGEDYGIWQSGYGHASPTFLTGDYNGDGFVDGEDYGVWQNNYNHTLASSDTVAAASQDAEVVSTSMAQAATAGIAPRLIAMTPASGATVTAQANLTLVFDSAVQVSAGAVEVSGLATGQHQDYTAAYNAATRTLTLTWAKALPADRYTVRVVASFVVGAGSGAALDGEVGDPASATLPSGDGSAGGDARLAFTAN
jgi:hypothetical protein